MAEISLVHFLRPFMILKYILVIYLIITNLFINSISDNINYRMTEVSLNQNFDELFIKAEQDPPQAAFIHLSLAGR